jgi:hypothetical protein
MTSKMLTTARTDALFISPLSAETHPQRAELDATIGAMVRRYRGAQGCAAEVAACFGDHPDVAVRRMRWSLRTIAAMYGPDPR